MAAKTIHACSECGFQSAQWHGQCPGCEAWNTLAEQRVLPTRMDSHTAHRSRRAAERPRSQPRPLREVGAAPVKRLSTGIGELDRVLGGGLVPGSLVLLGGSPGIGKSTLTNMALGHLQESGSRTLYVSGEESAEQVRLRADRVVGGAGGGASRGARSRTPRNQHGGHAAGAVERRRARAG